MARFVISQQNSLTNTRSQLRAAAANALQLVADQVDIVAKHIIEDAVANYDTAIPGETYIRRYDEGMAGAWVASPAKVLSDDTITCVIYNGVVEPGERGRHYAGLVQGDEQTHRHEGAGWKTITAIQKEHAREQSNRVRGAIQHALRT